MKHRTLPRLFILLSIMLVIFSFAACTAYQTGQTGKVALTIQGTVPLVSRSISNGVSAARTAAAPLAISVKNMAGTVIGTLTLSDARVAVKEINLELAESDIDTADDALENTDVDFSGPYVVDLLAETVTPALSEMEFPAGTYDQISLKLDKIIGTETASDGITLLVAAGDSLVGNSIYLTGTYTGSTAGGTVTDIPFTMSFDLDEEFDLGTAGAAANGLEINGGVTNSVIIAFRLVQWFDFSNTETNENNVDFTLLAVTTNAQGQTVIILDKDVQGDSQKVREVIKKNIENSADYGEDADNDGELSSAEDDDPDSEDTNDE